MAVPSQAAPSSRPRCRNCGRFVARGAELCSSCSTPIAIDAARAHLGLLEPQVRPLPEPVPPAPEPVPSEPAAAPEPRVALAIAPALRVVRAGRTRCVVCGRFISGSRTHCERCERASAAQLPLQPAAAPPKPVVSAALRSAPPPETWVYQRTRSDFVVPRPSELHPDPTADAEHRFMTARAAIVARGIRSHEEREHGSTRWAAVRSAAMRQRVALMVVAASAATGVALAMLMATR